MPAQRLTLIDYALLLLAKAVDALHLAFWAHIVTPLADPSYELTRERFERLTRLLFASEARLARAIAYAARRIAGLPWKPLALADFMRPAPRSADAAGMRLVHHARRLCDARKLALRFAARIRAAMEPKPSRPAHAPKPAFNPKQAPALAISLPRPTPQPRAPPILRQANLQHLAARRLRERTPTPKTREQPASSVWPAPAPRGKLPRWPSSTSPTPR